ncbi:MAG: hypothetical protein OXS28_19285 [Gammaproteobacteria bacterium]|nr:hypothetical protein [Gammaproteobacteria bacterium]
MLLYVFSPTQKSSKGKLVGKVDVYRTGRVVGKGNLKRKVRVNAVRTSGYVALANLKTQQHEVVMGELK